VAQPGLDRIEWAAGQMPVLAQVASRFSAERPLDGVRIAACLHVTAETAVLARVLCGGGAEFALCSANPLSAQDDVVQALSEDAGVEVHARHGEAFAEYEANVALLARLDRTWCLTTAAIC
jgi:adenosylhomocysteinase